jgi:Rieske Fe-S protein
MACKDCLNRREFLAKSALAAAALTVIEGCGDGQIGPTAVQRSGNPVTVNLADFPGLATVGVLVQLPNELAAMRTGPSTFLGLDRTCTHEGCEAFVQSTRIVCDCHGSIFASNGDVIQGPAALPLSKVSVQYNAAAATLTLG